MRGMRMKGLKIFNNKQKKCDFSNYNEHLGQRKLGIQNFNGTFYFHKS